ncbi:MAG: GerMN domain-containing protein [bacterium]|nr:MAG: GerMN domain-containing protein [bacterium]
MRKGVITAVILVVAALALLALGRQWFGGKAPGPPSPERPADHAAAGPQTRQVDLYFADVSGQRLSLERREVSGESREDLLLHVVEELIKGPLEPGRVRTLPETVQVRALFHRDGTVWVDLGSAVRDEHPGGSWTEVLAVYSVVNTLVENFGDIQQVQILIDGSRSETLAGHVDISGPLRSRIQLLAGDWE